MYCCVIYILYIVTSSVIETCCNFATATVVHLANVGILYVFDLVVWTVSNVFILIIIYV